MLNFIESTIVDMDNERVIKYSDKSYRIKRFEGRNAFNILAKLTKYGSKMFGGMLHGISNTEEESDAVAALIAGAIS